MPELGFWHISSLKISNGALIIDAGNAEAIIDCKTGNVDVENVL